MTQPVILVDVFNTAFRTGFAFKSLSNEGEKTGALFGFLKTIYELRQKVSRRMVFVWDHGIPTPGAPRPRNWRDEVVKGYKQNRGHQEGAGEILAQMSEIHRALCLLGYSSVSVLGLEADDIIGILASEISDALIFSTDKDFYQLLWPGVKVLTPSQHKGEYKTITGADVLREYGVHIEHWAEYLALGGDTADNIKPQRGMGPVTAARLIASGVDLKRHPSEQPPEFWMKYGPIWHKIQAAYCAAKLPTSWEDARITTCVAKMGRPHYHFDQKDSNERRFTTLLADYNMASLLAVRHGFFDTHYNGAAPCSPNVTNPSQSPSQSPRHRLV